MHSTAILREKMVKQKVLDGHSSTTPDDDVYHTTPFGTVHHLPMFTCHCSVIIWQLLKVVTKSVLTPKLSILVLLKSAELKG